MLYIAWACLRNVALFNTCLSTQIDHTSISIIEGEDYSVTIVYRLHIHIFFHIVLKKVRRWNKKPTTDLYDRMVILSTSLGYNNDLFKDQEKDKQTLAMGIMMF